MGLNLKSKLLYKMMRLMLEREYGKDPFSDPAAYQENVLLNELKHQSDTLYGRTYAFSSIKSIEDYQKNVPLTKVEDYMPYFRRMQAGSTNLLFKDELLAWMLTSGTTSEPKMIPYTGRLNHKLGIAPISIYMAYIDENPRENIKCFSGKFLSIVADSEVERINDIPVGYVSGIAMAIKSQSRLGGGMFTPSFDVFKETDWDKKYWKISEQATQQNVSMIAGIPGYIADYLARLDLDHKYRLGLDDKTIPEIWPNLKLMIWSGAKLESYIGRLKHLVGDNIDFREAYGGTEPGLIGYKIDNNPGMIPAIGNNFYEFIPMTEWRAMESEGGDYQNFEFNPRTYSEVKMGVDYAIVLTTPGGLYRYILGDSVVFTKGDPVRIDWSGRLNWYSNIAVERMTFSHVQNAITELGEDLGTRIPNFSYTTNFEPPQYHFVIETESDIDPSINVNELIDKYLMNNNAEYHFCRKRTLLDAPMVMLVPTGTYKQLETHQLALRSDKKGHYKAPRFTDGKTLELLKTITLPSL